MNIKKRPGVQKGFSLVEIMVGLTVGLITVLVVSQVMQVAEARRRASASGADAVVNAALGLYTIERDAKNSGYGLTSLKASVGCEVRARYGNADVDFTMTPARITDGANGAPDTLRFIASSKSGAALPTRISVNHPQTAANFFVESDLGVHDGDMMIAVPQSIVPGTNWCSVFQVTGTGGASGGGNGGNNNNGGGQGQNQILHNSGQSDWNQPGGSNIFPAGGYMAGDYVLNLGGFVDHTYSIANNQLRQTAANWTNNTSTDFDLYPNVVQLQAVYGKDTSVPPDNRVDVWEASAPAQWQQVIAVRIALVARSQTPEAENVTLDGADAATTCNSATPHPAAICWRPDPNGNGVKIDVNINNANPNWKRFRYRVVETTIPLRNAIWQQ